MSSGPDPAAFRAQFPVLDRIGYLNAGTEGPVPQAAADAVRERVQLECNAGRSGQRYMEAVKELAAALRSGYAQILGCRPQEVALTGSTTDGVNTVLAALDLRPGDEVLTSDEEHPGLLAPLALARRRRDITVRAVPFSELAGAVGATTRLVACSHVSWVGGLVVDHAGLTGTGVPVLLDGAQGIGAVPVDVAALGCDFYAASGQKWLCGPENSGCLFVRPECLPEMEIAWPGYGSLADPHDPLDSPPAEGAARFDHGFPPGIRSVWALASLAVLNDAGWGWIHSRAAELAARLAAALSARGITVSPRGRSTLVSWQATDPEAEVARLAADGLVVRSIPASGLVRASVGAWSSEAELDKLVTLASG